GRRSRHATPVPRSPPPLTRTSGSEIRVESCAITNSDVPAGQLRDSAPARILAAFGLVSGVDADLGMDAARIGGGVHLVPLRAGNNESGPARCLRQIVVQFGAAHVERPVHTIGRMPRCPQFAK